MTQPHASSKRLLPAGLALAICLLPALASAQTRSRSATTAAPVSTRGSPVLGAPIGAFDYGLLLGLELPPSGLSVGPRITGEMMYGFMDLGPQLRLDLGGRASFAYHGGDSVSTWLVDAVPDAKLRFAVSDLLGVYGDVGLGLGLLHSSGVDVPSGLAGLPGFSGSDSTIALTFQVGGGATYAISPTMNLLGEVRLNVYTRSGSSTFLVLPAVGIQWH